MVVRAAAVTAEFVRDFAHEKVMLIFADGRQLAEPDEPLRLVHGGGFFRLQHLDGGVEQDCAEDVADPGEALQQAYASGDEGTAHEDGAGDSPEKHARLACFGNAEEAEEQKEDEQVIDRKGLLDGVAGEVLDCAVGAVVRGEYAGERERRGGPQSDGVERLCGGCRGPRGAAGTPRPSGG